MRPTLLLPRQLIHDLYFALLGSIKLCSVHIARAPPVKRSAPSAGEVDSIMSDATAEMSIAGKLVLGCLAYPLHLPFLQVWYLLSFPLHHCHRQ